MNPNLNAFLTQLKLFLVLIGGIMAEQGLEQTTVYHYIMLIAGSILVVGNAAWALWASYSNWRNASAVGVAAGINMTVQGKAITQDGTVISKFGAESETTPPKPVTVATAAEIVANFAPSTTIAKS